MAKKTYEVLSPVNYDGVRYEVGDPIDVEDKHAKSLKESGDIGPQSEKSSTAPESEDDRIAAIVIAIGKLDKADTALWTTAGTPKTDGLTAVTGWPVAAKERDAAWAQINQEK